MNAEDLTRGLTTRRLGQRVHYADVVGSTNEVAAEALQREPLPEGTAFVASRQQRGKGTGGSRWLSADPDGVWCSVVFHEPTAVAPLSFLPGVALVDVLRDYGIDAHVKWPNDVVVEGRKLCGSLIESQRAADGAVAWVMGIGVNVNQQRFPGPIAETAVSMRMVTGREYDRSEVFRRLMEQLERHYVGGSDLVSGWRERTRMIGRRVRVRRKGAPFAATVLDVSSEGHLGVALDDGTRETWVASVDLDIDPDY